MLVDLVMACKILFWHSGVGVVKEARVQFQLLKDRVKHKVFNRVGGVSEGPYASLNVGENVGDDPAHVERNLQKIQEEMQVDTLLRLTQVHGDQIRTDSGEGDALITDRPKVGLCIRHADCQAALMFDPVKKRIAAVHAGWKGQVLDIYAKVIREMGSNPTDLLVAISPSLGPNCAEFLNYRNELPSWFWNYKSKIHHFNLWAIAEKQLQDAGVPKGNIEIAEVCTCCRPNEYYSYRRDGKTGRNASILCL